MIILWIFFLNFVVIFGYQNEPPCNIQGIGNMVWWIGTFNFPDKINDNHEGVTVEFKCTNVKEVELKDSKYLNVFLADNTLTFSVTDEFKNFEENDAAFNIEAQFYMKCLPKESTKTTSELLDKTEQAEDIEYHLKLVQSIHDLNTFIPEFTKDEYVFQYYQDLLTSTILTDAQRISAEDRDISVQMNGDLSFTIEKNDYFSISKDRRDDHNKRLIHAKVKPEKYIKAPFKESFTITVSDNGKPEPKTSTSKLTVELFTEQTFVFTKSVYQAELVGKDMNIVDGPITIVGGLDLGLEFKITSGDDIANKFEIMQTIKSISIHLRQSLDPELIKSKDYLYLTITANKVGRIGHFAVMIKTNRGGIATTVAATITTTTLTEEPETTPTEEPEITPTEEPETTPNVGQGIMTSLDRFQAWILAGSLLIWISFVLLAIAFLMVMFSFKKFWQKKYNF